MTNKKKYIYLCFFCIKLFFRFTEIVLKLILCISFGKILFYRKSLTIPSLPVTPLIEMQNHESRVCIIKYKFKELYLKDTTAITISVTRLNSETKYFMLISIKYFCIHFKLFP